MGEMTIEKLSINNRLGANGKINLKINGKRYVKAIKKDSSYCRYFNHDGYTIYLNKSYNNDYVLENFELMDF